MMAMGPAQSNTVSVSPDVNSSIEGGGCCCLIGEPALASEVRPQAKAVGTGSQGDGLRGYYSMIQRLWSHQYQPAESKIDVLCCCLFR
jgi:hypothetical protein